MEDNFNSIVKPILEKYGESIVGEMINRLKNLGKKATGNLIDSLDFGVDDTNANNITLYFTAIDYAIYVDKGRRPGKFPPIKSIRDWCKIKRIPVKAAFPIARKISEKGIRPTNFFTVSTSRRLKQMNKELAKSLGDEIAKKIVAVEGLNSSIKIN